MRCSLEIKNENWDYWCWQYGSGLISVAETIQQLAPNAKVVEAFNTTSSEINASSSRQFGSDFPSVFYCGDDMKAKQIVADLIEECGYEAVDAGKLIVARVLETLATAWV